MRAIEVEREAGRVGSSLQAGVAIHAGENIAPILEGLADDLKFVMITSAASVSCDKTLDADSVVVSVTPLSHAKCGRCWHLRDDVGSDTAHPDLCGRCVSNLFGTGEQRAWA